MKDAAQVLNEREDWRYPPWQMELRGKIRYLEKEQDQLKQEIQEWMTRYYNLESVRPKGLKAAIRERDELRLKLKAKTSDQKDAEIDTLQKERARLRETLKNPLQWKEAYTVLDRVTSGRMKELLDKVEELEKKQYE